MSVINNHGLTAKLSGAAGKPCHEAKCTTRVRLSAGLGGRVRDRAGYAGLWLFASSHTAQDIVKPLLQISGYF
jgi:hypothetical protein